VILESVRRRSALGLLVAFAAHGALAQAQQPARPADPAPAETPERGVALWLTHAESDNVARTEGSERGSYDGLGVLLDLSHESTRFDSSLNTNLELRRYSDDLIDNEPVGTLDGQMNVGLVPDRVSWLLQESYGQGQTDAFAATGPNNRESINVFTTGPRFDLPLGGRFALSAGAMFSSRRYDESASLDSDAETYDVGLFRQTSQRTRYGLVLAANEIEYDVTGALAYDIDRASLNYERAFATGGVSLAVGTNEVSILGQTTDEPLFNFAWSRELATRSTLRIEAAREFSDTATNLTTDLGQTPVGGDPSALVSASPFEQERLFVSYALAGARTDLDVSLGTAEENYLGGLLDNDNTTTRVSLQRTVTPRLAFGIGLYHVEREFAGTSTQPARDDTEKTISAWVNRSLGRLFDLALVLTSYEFRGDQHFDEDRYEIRFTYSPSDSASDALGAAGR